MPTMEYPIRILENDLNRRVREKKPDDKEGKPKKTPKKSELVYGYRKPKKK